MITVLFKNVGQGDSILLEWDVDHKKHYGIIDCKLYQKQNPILDEIIKKGIKELDFVLISHLHLDHFSGCKNLLTYCLENTIKIKLFLHTFRESLLPILTIIYSNESQSDQKSAFDFLSFYLQITQRNDIIEDYDSVTHNFREINLDGKTQMKFRAPSDSDYTTIMRQRAQFENKKIKSKPDLNIVATILEIKDETESVILTSDATKSSFNRIRKKILNTVVLIQVPHHGSINNHDEIFWNKLNKKNPCPSVYSVGEDGDKLPNFEVVEFFDNAGFYNESTNHVYGLTQFYPTPHSTISTPSPTLKAKHLAIAPFAKKSLLPLSSSTSSRFTGDKSYTVL